MAGKNWQAGSKISLAIAIMCLIASAFPLAHALAASGGFAPLSYVGSLDPNMIWEALIGGIVVASFLGAVAIWVVSALRRAQRSQLRRNAFVSSALNHLNQGVVMTDPTGRVVFVNDRYLEVYGLSRAEVSHA
jgi:PAS domain-containing protein